jgi:hypothetical protein
MSSPQYIIDFKKQMVERHVQRIQQQMLDQKFLENTYPLTLIKKVDYQMRTNFAARMINAVTQQLISNLPKAYTAPNVDTKVAKESSKNVSIFLNKCIGFLLQYPSNPFEQTFKNFNYRGDTWLYTPHNADVAKNGYENYPGTLPVHFILYDPMVVFSDPNEEIDGEPKRVIVLFQRTVSDIRQFYPKWSNPKNTDTNKKCEFVLYFDKEKSYAEADGEPLFNDDEGKLLNGTGERGNPYGCVPFVHMYSGWGFESQERNPELLAYSRIRLLRDLITEDSQVRSDQLYNFHTFAHRSKTLYLPAGAELGTNWKDSYKNEPDKLNVLTLPEGADPNWFKVEDSQLFEPAAFAYADRIRSDLGQEFPAPLQGVGGTSSGREANILSGNALAIYDCAVENTSLTWAKGFLKALKVCQSLDILPDPITPDDIKRVNSITVDLRTDDPIARDRQITMGSTLVDNGKRSLKTFLMKDMRMTEDEADEEIDNILEDKIILQSPEIAAFLGYKAAQKSGMADELQAYREQTQGKTQIEMGSPVGSKGGQPRQGNIKTPMGREMVDVNQTVGQRLPPTPTSISGG